MIYGLIWCSFKISIIRVLKEEGDNKVEKLFEKNY